jgi:hypothetical protein
MRYIALLIIILTAGSASSGAAVRAPLGGMDPAALEDYYPPGAWKHDFMAVVTLRFGVSDHGFPENIEVTRLRFSVVDEPAKEIPLSEALSGFPAQFMAGADYLLRKLHFDAASANAGPRSISIAFLLGPCDQIPHEDLVDYYLTVCRARQPAQIIVR